MSTVLENKPASRGGVADKLAFFNGLQSVTNKIHATTNLDEIMLELGRDICSLFDADRLTIYVASDGGKSIVSKVKTGLNSFKDIKLPINEQCVAGYVALHKRVINIRDVYDDEELKSLQPAAQLPEGGRHQDRLSHAADAGRAGRRCADEGADRRHPDHQFRSRRAVSAGRWRKASRSSAKRSRSRCASGSGR